MTTSSSADTAARPRIGWVPGVFSGRPGALPRTPPPLVQSLLAAAVYAAFVIWFTWPVAPNLGDTIYGAPGDLTGSIANLRELVDGWHNPFLPGTLPDFNAPEGQPITWALNLAVWPSMTMLYALAVPFGATASFSLFTFFGYVASALGMFLLVRKLTGHAWIALVIGFAYGFYPFVVVNGAGHNFFVHGWVFVLIAWRMLELLDAPTLRNSVYAALAVILAISWAPYFVLMGGVLFGTLIVGLLVSAWREGDLQRHLKLHLVAAGIVLAYLAALSAITLGSEQGSLRENPLEALNVYSARPLEYVLPPQGQLFLGDTTGPYLRDHLHGSNFTESTLYVGLTVLLLAVIGLGAALFVSHSARLRRLSLISLGVGIVGFAFSAPPRVSLLGELVPFPSWFVFQLTSTWRVYSRFVMVVMLAVCLLAAIGLRHLVVGRPRAAQLAVLALFSVAIPLDLYVEPFGDTATNKLVTPQIYDVLRRQPPGIVAQYPLYPNGYGDYQELFYQQDHGKPMLNGYASLPQEERDLTLADLSEPATARGLATLGVKYVFVPDIPVEPPVRHPGMPGRGFRLIASGPYGPATASLYRVVAEPGPPLAAPTGGFAPAEGPPDEQYRWMTASSATIAITGACDPCRGTLRFRATSFARRRTVLTRSAEGGLLARRRIAGPAEFAVPLRFSRRTSVEISASPGPEPISAQIRGNADDRSVSVQIADLRFVPARARSVTR